MAKRKINIYANNQHGIFRDNTKQGYKYLCSSLTDCKTFKQYIDTLIKNQETKNISCSSEEIKKTLYEWGIIQHCENRNYFYNNGYSFKLEWDKN